MAGFHDIPSHSAWSDGNNWIYFYCHCVYLFLYLFLFVCCFIFCFVCVCFVFVLPVYCWNIQLISSQQNGRTDVRAYVHEFHHRYYRPVTGIGNEEISHL